MRTENYADPIPTYSYVFFVDGIVRKLCELASCAILVQYIMRVHVI